MIFAIVLILILAMLEIFAFSWVFGLDVGWEEIHHGAQIRIPAIFRFIMKWVAPTYLTVVLIAFCIQNLPEAQKRYSDHLISHIPEGVKRVLDVGCAFGSFLDLARRRGWEVQGVEVEEETGDHKAHLVVVLVVAQACEFLQDIVGGAGLA